MPSRLCWVRLRSAICSYPYDPPLIYYSAAARCPVRDVFDAPWRHAKTDSVQITPHVCLIAQYVKKADAPLGLQWGRDGVNFTLWEDYCHESGSIVDTTMKGYSDAAEPLHGQNIAQ